MVSRGVVFRWAARLIVAPFVFMTGGSTTKAAAATPKRPNIVIIVADDMGWADVGYHGAKTATPNIDRLAGEGVRLENFHVAPLCSPTRAGLLTGRWPQSATAWESP